MQSFCLFFMLQVSLLEGSLTNIYQPFITEKALESEEYIMTIMFH